MISIDTKLTWCVENYISLYVVHYIVFSFYMISVVHESGYAYDFKAHGPCCPIFCHFMYRCSFVYLECTVVFHSCVSDCCLVPNEQFFSYIMVRTS